MKKLVCVTLLLLALTLLLVAHAEEYGIADIIPDSSVWGMTAESFQSASPGSYTSTKVGKAPALVKKDLSVEGYPMSAYYVFAGGKLSKITYILTEDADKSTVKACAAQLSEAMTTTLGIEGAEGKGVTEWNDGSIQIGTAKLKNYTGKKNPSACIIFKQPDAATQPVPAPVEAETDSTLESVREWIDQAIGIGETISNLKLENRTLSMSINLGSGGILPIEDLAEARAGSITDEILDHTEFDSEWDKIVISFTGVRDYTFTKDDIITIAIPRNVTTATLTKVV